MALRDLNLLRNLKRFLPEAWDELKRQAVQGSMEFASALYTGQAFVLYGPGQYSPSEQQKREEQDRGMEI